MIDSLSVSSRSPSSVPAGHVAALFLLQVVIQSIALAAVAWLLDGFRIDTVLAALAAGVFLSVAGTVVWPIVARLLLPVSVLTLGIGSLVAEAIVVLLVLRLVHGVSIDGVGAATLVVLLTTVVSSSLNMILAVDDDAWFDRQQARRINRHRRRRDPVSDVPGMVFIQLDGLAHEVAHRAMRSGDLPTLHRWLRSGSHSMSRWEAAWSCQTGVSQIGILHGSTEDMPAFRWVEKDTGTTLVSNLPRSAAEIERRHSDGNGLLSFDGSSYGNLFTGDAERAVLTMSVAGRTKGHIGAGYGGYFSRPNNVARTAASFVAELWRERRANASQRRNDVQPRIERDRKYAFLRAFTTVITRDVSMDGIIGDMAEGRSVIYVDFLGYDEVAHHSGPERADTLAVLRDLDRCIHRLERVAAIVDRPYRFVVLSDHGQSQGPTFTTAYGVDFPTFVRTAALLPTSPSTSAASDRQSRTEGWSYLSAAVGIGTCDEGPVAKGLRTLFGSRDRPTLGPGDEADLGAASPSPITVLASGNLGLVYLAGIAIEQAVEAGGDMNAPAVMASVATLDANSVALSEVITSVAGADNGETFLGLWRDHIGFFVDYTLGTATGDAAMTQQALTDLDGYRVATGALFEEITAGNLQAADVEASLSEHVATLTAAIDALVAADGTAFAKLRVAGQHMPMSALAISTAVVAATDAG